MFTSRFSRQILRAGVRSFNSARRSPNSNIRPFNAFRAAQFGKSTFLTVNAFSKQQQSSQIGALLGLMTGVALGSTLIYADNAKDYEAVKKAILDMMEDLDYDDGSYGPVFVRLAWHASGTYDKSSKTGGSNGATMRFNPEAGHGANAGLDVARSKLEPIKKQFPWISYSDLWTLAGSLAIEEMGGPKIDWVPGRSDAPDEKSCPPDGRLPDASKDQSHVRDIFYRMGFNDREIVALCGAHALGRCHTDRSGFWGPWTRAPTSFTNEYYRELIENTWTPKKWKGPLQYEDPSGELMMLPSDIALIKDDKFKKYVEMYAKDQALWHKDFAAAWKKLIELGVPGLEKKSWWSSIFG